MNLKHCVGEKNKQTQNSIQLFFAPLPPVFSHAALSLWIKALLSGVFSLRRLSGAAEI
jgi:hypothetical protein